MLLETGDVLLDDETEFVTVRAVRGKRPNTPSDGGKLVVTQHRTVFFNESGVEAISHHELNRMSVTPSPETRKYELFAGLLALVGVAAAALRLTTFTNMGTWEGFLLPFVAVGAFIGAAVAYRMKIGYYETLELDWPNGVARFSICEEEAFVKASKVIAQNWRRRDPKF